VPEPTDPTDDAAAATPADAPHARVLALTGIYDADGTVLGEVRYVVMHLLGRAECVLCDITHGPLRRKAAFDDLRGRLGIPFETVHRDERSPEVAAASEGRLPCVVALVERADGTTGHEVLLDADALRACAGDVARFEPVLRDAIGRRQRAA
jgi:hypothetical protein